MVHALRHSPASALIAAGLDVLTSSRRLGHASAAFTLNTYMHLFADKADAAAHAIDAAMGRDAKGVILKKPWVPIGCQLGILLTWRSAQPD